MAIESQGTTLEIETGDGAANDITAITQAAICQVSSTSHGMSRGDVVTFQGIVGMTELNDTTAMVIAVETDEFWIDVDTSGYSAYTSDGTATPALYTAVGEVVDWDGPGGTSSIINVTHLQSTAHEKMAGLLDEGQYTMSINWDLGNDAGQQACNAARLARTKLGWRLTYSDGTAQTWQGYCIGFSSSGAVDDKVNADITIEITGAVTTA